MTFHIQAMHPDKLPAYKIHLSFIGHSTRTFLDNKPRNRSVYSKIFQSNGGEKREHEHHTRNMFEIFHKLQQSPKVDT